MNLESHVADLCGNGLRIGLIDTGVDSRHPAFAGALRDHYDVLERDGGLEVRRRPRGIDYDDHGTACAGILHALAPGAEIHSLCVLGRERDRLHDRLVRAIGFACERDWDILNLSLGARDDSAGLRRAVRRAREEGRILIAARDNHPGRIGFPAASPDVLGVDMEAFAHPFDFRRREAGADGIELLARGIYVEAPTAGGGQGLHTGASFAAPHVTAFAARLREGNPGLDLSALRRYFAEAEREPVPAG